LTAASPSALLAASRSMSDGKTQRRARVDVRELYERGLKLRRKLFGNEAVEKRMNALAEFGEPLQHIINAYAYGDVWQRPGLPLKMKSLAILGMTAALNRPEEFRVHMNGALTNGCTPDEIREILLLVAVYCGIPAANEAHRIAYETINARKCAQR
jgi:4-carboxymuconolactone decarboxylase